jgi:hypothetical protein
MPSAAQGVSLLLSWRPDQERRRLPAGTGDLGSSLSAIRYQEAVKEKG